MAVIRLGFSFISDKPDIGECLKQEVQGTATIMEEPERKETGQVFFMAQSVRVVVKNGDQNKECAENIFIRVKTKLYPRFEYGDEILFKGKISKPFNFRSDTGRSFNYEGFLAKDNVYYEIKSGIAELVTHSHSFDLNRWLYSLKRGFVSNLEKVLGEPHAALAAGLVVGEKSALGKNLIDDFRTVGLIHIVVLSGYNITIVADALRRILSFLPRIWGIFAGGLGIGMFGILVGGGATVVRSCFMAGIALSGEAIRRDYSVIRALAFAALVMLIQNPLILLHDPSFQLSFLATLGLILLAGPIESFIEKRLSFIPEKFGMRGIVASTVATQIFVSPYILYMMGQMSIIGMVVNILVLPFVPVTMLTVFLAGMSGFVWMPVAQFFGYVAHALLTYELLMVETFAQIPFASVTLKAFSGWWVGGFYLLLGLVYFRKSFFHTKQSFQVVFESLKKLPASTLIDNPEKMVKTPFNCSRLEEVVDSKKIVLFFTRRSLKHLAEKGRQGEELFIHISRVLNNPTLICSTERPNRFICAASESGDKVKRYRVVILDRSNKKTFVIVTTFIAKQKYLKGFKILWRTAIS